MATKKGTKRKIVLRIVIFILALYFFLVSIKLMGSSVKFLGKDFATFLLELDASPFVALFVGILATTIVQSSSATTSVIVGLVAAGTIPIGGAIPMVMGANIGTTVTNTIVSLAHVTRRKEFGRAFQVATIHDLFNFFAVAVLLPLELMFHGIEKTANYLAGLVVGQEGDMFSSPLNAIIKPMVETIKSGFGDQGILMLLFSFFLLFGSLQYIVNIIRPVAKKQFKEYIHDKIFKSPIRSFGVGLGLTVIAQSSSITTSLLIPLAGVGILTSAHVFPYIIGANIGTTLTALIASSVTGSIAAVTVALSHTIFNVVGSAIIYPFRKYLVHLSTALGDLAYAHRSAAIAYLVGIFFILPFLIIYVFH